MSSMASPLHGVVDARRWNAERLLGRLVIMVHAAFLDAGFIVPRRHRRDRDLSSTCRLPTEVGATASTLSLEYTAPQLLPRHDMGAAVLRICTNGQHVIFYLQLQVRSVRISPHLVCLDAYSVAPLLSGRLNGTARRMLRNDGSPTAALWRKVSDGFSRRIFSDLCLAHGVVPGRAPTLMSLPGDAMAAILERLADGKDLLRVESTCIELRRFVADRDRQLWMPRYKALREDRLRCWWWLLLHGYTDSHEDLPETSTSWKEMFVRAARRREHWFFRPSRILISPRFSSLDSWNWLFRSDSFELPVDAAACFGEMMTEMEDDGGKNTAGRRHGHGKAPGTGGHEKQKQQGRRSRTGTGAIHSPSSRYRWKHR